MKGFKRITAVIFIIATMLCLAVGLAACEIVLLDEEHTHELELVEAVDSTCTQEGNTRHYTCKGCHKNFADEDGLEELSDSQVVVAKKAHQLSEVAAEESTCTEEGTVRHWNCAVCKQNFADDQGKELLTDLTMAKKKHQLTEHKRVEPQVGVAGKKAHWECSSCGKFFLDGDGEEEVEEDTLTIPALVKLRYEAEEAEFGAGKGEGNSGNGNPRIEKNTGSSGDPNGNIVGNIGYNSGMSLTFRFVAEEDMTATLYAAFNVRNGDDRRLSKAFIITVNGVELETEAIMPTEAATDWNKYVAIEVGEVEFKAGEETVIVFTTVQGVGDNAANMDYIELVSPEGIARLYSTIREAESGTSLTKGASSLNGGMLDPQANASASGGKILGNINGNNGATATYNFNVAEGGTFYLYASVCLRKTELKFSDAISLNIGGVELETDAVVPAPAEGQSEWSTYVTLKLGTVTFKAGINSMLLTVKSTGENGFNIDRFTFVGTEPITNLGATLENGKYEAEDCKIYTGNPSIGGENMPSASGGKIVGNLSRNTSVTLTYKVYAETAGDVELLVAVCRRGTEIKFTDALNVTVNGTAVTSEAKVPAADTDHREWYYFETVSLGTVHLNQGENTITFNPNAVEGFSLDFFQLKGDILLTAII